MNNPLGLSREQVAQQHFGRLKQHERQALWDDICSPSDTFEVRVDKLIALVGRPLTEAEFIALWNAEQERTR